MVETLVVTDSALDADRLMLADVDTAEGPTFTVSEVAKFFFARSSHWIRWLETKQAFTDPESGENTASRRTEKGARVYTLSDVEKMTHALAANGKISAAQASNALHVTKTMAKIWEFLP